VDIVRNIPARGPKGWQIWLGATTVILYGYYTIGKTNRQRAQQKLEDRRIRYAMAPLLQAEADREYMTREKENLRREIEIMKDVKGWIPYVSPYNSQKFMKRSVDPMNKSA
jgi:NADH dehydrogenase (ubiquinone) 1 alpha subcomplex subunit 13